MVPNEAFLDACADGDLQKMQQATASNSPTAEHLDEGLALATEGAHPEVVAALFAAGTTLSGQALDFLPGKDCSKDCKQSPIVTRHFLDQGMSPNARLSNGEPLLRYAPRLVTSRGYSLQDCDAPSCPVPPAPASSSLAAQILTLRAPVVSARWYPPSSRQRAECSHRSDRGADRMRGPPHLGPALRRRCTACVLGASRDRFASPQRPRSER